MEICSPLDANCADSSSADNGVSIANYYVLITVTMPSFKSGPWRLTAAAPASFVSARAPPDLERRQLPPPAARAGCDQSSVEMKGLSAFRRTATVLAFSQWPGGHVGPAREVRLDG